MLGERWPTATRGLKGAAHRLRATLGEDAVGDASYDAVFDFAIIHDVSDWRDAVAEIPGC